MFRKRLCFSKKGNLKFIGHLDFLRVFGETITRSRLPVSYSAGFNPHILLSFALPLPLGFVSENDYADLVFHEDVPSGEIMSGLNNAAPNGLVIKNVYDALELGVSSYSNDGYKSFFRNNETIFYWITEGSGGPKLISLCKTMQMSFRLR